VSQPSFPDALATFYARAWYTPALKQYLAEHKVDLSRILPHVGAIGLLDVAELPGDRFEFPCGQLVRTAIACLIFEALDDDEEPYDLVALPIGEPQAPMSLFGSVGFLSHASVFWPGSYSLGKAMPVHRHPLAWLQAGCAGTAIVHPQKAAREMLDIPGPLTGQDWAHCRELKRIAESVVDLRRITTQEAVGTAA
jgi:hypothetical protein